MVGKEIWRPQLHFTPKKGWINDPNGLVYFRGKYHLFFQYNPFHCSWDSMHWGHAVSDDLLHWEELEIALYPDQEYDRHKEGGCFSGSVVVKEDRMYLFYTGCIKQGEKVIQSQCMAVSEDGLHFAKYPLNPVISGPPQGGGPDFRDPRVVWAQGRYRMLCGGTDGMANDRKSHGRIYLYSSDDLIRWEYQGILAQACEGEGSMFECPDIFPLGEKWVIAVSPMYRADGRQNIYMMGELDFDACSFQVERKGLLDAGPHYYAVQTYADGENRPLSIAWLGGWSWMPWIRGLPPTDAEGYRGALGIPRRIRMDEEGYLCAEFAPEIGTDEKKRHYTKTLALSDQENPFWKRLRRIDGAVFLRFRVNFGDWKEKKLQIILLESGKELERGLEQKRQQAQICFTIDYEEGKCTADFSRADAHTRALAQGADKSCIHGFPFETGNPLMEIELAVDRSVCTLLLQHGRHAYTCLFFPPDGQSGIQMKAAESGAALENVEHIG